MTYNRKGLLQKIVKPKFSSSVHAEWLSVHTQAAVACVAICVSVCGMRPRMRRQEVGWAERSDAPNQSGD